MCGVLRLDIGLVELRIGRRLQRVELLLVRWLQHRRRRGGDHVARDPARAVGGAGVVTHHVVGDRLDRGRLGLAERPPGTLDFEQVRRGDKAQRRDGPCCDVGTPLVPGAVDCARSRTAGSARRATSVSESTEMFILS
jgi:hypothetical protein